MSCLAEDYLDSKERMMAGTNQTLSVGSITGAGQTTTAISVGDNRTLKGAQLFVYGTFTANIAVQVSADGTNYVAASTASGVSLAGISAPGTFLLGGDATHIRLTTNSHSSGTVNVDLVWSEGEGTIPT